MKSLLLLLFATSVFASPPDSPYEIIQGANGLQYHTGLIQTPFELDEPKTFAELSDCENLPDSFDLRELGYVSSVKDQGQCGSCSMFSKTSSFESALLKIGKAFDLSEQELVSNDKSNYGCEGGFMGFDYQVKHGQGLESDFPYTSGRTGSNGKSKNISVAAKGLSWAYVGGEDRSPTDKEIKCALYTHQSVLSVTVGATNAWGSPPQSEKTAYKNCGRSQTNHMVGIVGWWTDANGKTQYLMKNSWGKNWGDKGYMSISKDCNNFAESVAYISVEGK